MEFFYMAFLKKCVMGNISHEVPSQPSRLNSLYCVTI